MLEVNVPIDISSRYFENQLNTGKLTLHQLSARRFRARKSLNLELCIQLAIAAELHLLDKKLNNEEGE